MAKCPQRNNYIKPGAAKRLKLQKLAKVYVATGSREKATKAIGVAHDTGYSRALFRDPDVRRMIAEERTRLLAKLELTGEVVLRELMKLGFSNMQDYLHAGEDGQPVLDYASITRDQAAALSEVTVDERILAGTRGKQEDGEDDAEGKETAKPAVLSRKTRFKLHDKRAALESLGKHLGLFEQDSALKDISVGVQVLIKNA